MSDSYFVKYKSRLQGPFSVDQLKLLMKRGKLTRAHLVSEDRKVWVALGEIKGIVKETTTTQESEHVADTPPQNVHQDQPVSTPQPPSQPIGNPQQTYSEVQPQQYGQHPHRGTMILVFGILGLVVCMLLGIVAWVMGSGDLKKMDAGVMDPKGRGITQAGKIIGMVATILAIVGIALWFLIFFLAIAVQ